MMIMIDDYWFGSRGLIDATPEICMSTPLGLGIDPRLQRIQQLFASEKCECLIADHTLPVKMIAENPLISGVNRVTDKCLLTLLKERSLS